MQCDSGDWRGRFRAARRAEGVDTCARKEVRGTSFSNSTHYYKGFGLGNLGEVSSLSAGTGGNAGEVCEEINKSEQPLRPDRGEGYGLEPEFPARRFQPDPERRSQTWPGSPAQERQEWRCPE